jgi:hypothetical protein
MEERRQWRGRITGGRFQGYEVEIRASGQPLPIYVIAYRELPGEATSLVCFAVGTRALRQHFLDLDVRVLWDEAEEGREGASGRPGRRTGSGKRRWLQPGATVSRSRPRPQIPTEAGS